MPPQLCSLRVLLTGYEPMPTEPSNWVLKRSRAGATMVSSPVDSRRDTERNGRSLPFAEDKWSFTACTIL